MNIIEEYVKWSDSVYYGSDGCDDDKATVIKPFLNYKLGETVVVSVEYISGDIFVNEKKLIFRIVDEVIY